MVSATFPIPIPIPVPVPVPIGGVGFNNGPGFINGGYRPNNGYYGPVPYNNGGSHVRVNVRRVIY